MKFKTKRKVFCAGLGIALLVAFSSLFTACPSAIDDLTDVNDKIKRAGAEAPPVGALDVWNKTTAKNITKIEVETIPAGDPVRTITGNIIKDEHIAAFLGEGGYRVTLTLNDASIISEDVEIELDQVTTLYFDVVGGVDTITEEIGSGSLPPSATRGTLKITNTSPPNVATITSVKIKDMIANTESVYPAAIAGGGPSWVCTLDAGGYVVSVSTAGTSYTEEIHVVITAGDVVELQYRNASLIFSSDPRAEMGTLKINNISEAGYHTITNVRIKNQVTGEYVDFSEVINGGNSWSVMRPEGVYVVSISENNGATYPAASETNTALYQGVTTEISYKNSLPDDGASVILPATLKAGGLQIEHDIYPPGGTILSVRLSADGNGPYTYLSGSDFPLSNRGDRSEVYNFPADCGLHVAQPYIDSPIWGIHGWVDTGKTWYEIRANQTTTIRWSELYSWMGRLTYASDMGTVKLALTLDPGNSLPVSYPNYKLSNVLLTNLGTGEQIDLLDGNTLNDNSRVMSTERTIPIGAYSAYITYWPISVPGYIQINSTADARQPVIVNVYKDMKTELTYTFMNNYWDSVYTSTTSPDEGRLKVFSTLPSGVDFTSLEIYRPPVPAPTDRLCNNPGAATGAILERTWSGRVTPWNNETVDNLAPGTYWVRVKRSDSANWIGRARDYWKAITIVPRKETALYFSTYDLREQPE
jgi:hypothetical protein